MKLLGRNISSMTGYVSTMCATKSRRGRRDKSRTCSLSTGDLCGGGSGIITTKGDKCQPHVEVVSTV